MKKTRDRKQERTRRETLDELRAASVYLRMMRARRMEILASLREANSHLRAAFDRLSAASHAIETATPRRFP